MEIYKRDNYYSLQICQIINGIVFQSYNYLILFNKTYKIVNLFVSTCIINRRKETILSIQRIILSSLFEVISKIVSRRAKCFSELQLDSLIYYILFDERRKQRSIYQVFRERIKSSFGIAVVCLIHVYMTNQAKTN